MDQRTLVRRKPRARQPTSILERGDIVVSREGPTVMTEQRRLSVPGDPDRRGRSASA